MEWTAAIPPPRALWGLSHAMCAHRGDSVTSCNMCIRFSACSDPLTCLIHFPLMAHEVSVQCRTFRKQPTQETDEEVGLFFSPFPSRLWAAAPGPPRVRCGDVTLLGAPLSADPSSRTSSWSASTPTAWPWEKTTAAWSSASSTEGCPPSTPSTPSITSAASPGW